MKRFAVPFLLAPILLTTNAQDLPQIPPIQPPTTPLPLLCSAVNKWTVRLVAAVVSKTPNDAGSHEEWHQNFIVLGNGPFSSSYKVNEFAFDPHDEIPANAPPHTVAGGDLPGALTFANSRPEESIMFGGKETDAWPNPDDKLPVVTFKITNTCHNASALTAALQLLPAAKCEERDGRKACYTISVTPGT